MSTRPKHLPAKERRVATVEAVVELAAEQNPSEITTAAIAERMGLTQGALFRHFPNKDAILQAVMATVSKRLLARVDKAAHDAPSALAALEAIFMAHIGFIAEHPGVPRILFGELQQPDETMTKRLVQTLLQRYGEQLCELLNIGKKKGEIDPNLDVDSAAMLFIGSIQGMVVQSLLTGRDAEIRDDARRTFAIYRRGIEAVR